MKVIDAAWDILQTYLPFVVAFVAGDDARRGDKSSYVEVPKDAFPGGVIPEGQNSARFRAQAMHDSVSPTFELEHMSASSRDNSLKYLYETVTDVLRGNNGPAHAILSELTTRRSPLLGVALQMQAYLGLLMEMAGAENVGEFYSFMFAYRLRVFTEIASFLEDDPISFEKLANYVREVSLGPGAYIERLFDKVFGERMAEPAVRAVKRDLTARMKDIGLFKDVHLSRQVWNEENVERIRQMSSLAKSSSRFRVRTFNILFPLAIISEMGGTSVEVDIDHFLYYREGFDMTVVDSALERLIYAGVKHVADAGNKGRHIMVTWDDEKYVLLIEDDKMSVREARKILGLAMIGRKLKKVRWTIGIKQRAHAGITVMIHPKKGDIVNEEDLDPSGSQGGGGRITGYAPTTESPAGSSGQSTQGLNMPMTGLSQFAPLAALSGLVPAAPMWAAGGMAPAGIVPEIAARTFLGAL